MSFASPANAATGAHYISYRPLFFRDGRDRFTDPDSGQLLTDDGVHLNDYGASRFAVYLREH